MLHLRRTEKVVFPVSLSREVLRFVIKQIDVLECRWMSLMIVMLMELFLSRLGTWHFRGWILVGRVERGRKWLPGIFWLRQAPACRLPWYWKVWHQHLIQIFQVIFQQSFSFRDWRIFQKRRTRPSTWKIWIVLISCRPPGRLSWITRMRILNWSRLLLGNGYEIWFLLWVSRGMRWGQISW